MFSLTSCLVSGANTCLAMVSTGPTVDKAEALEDACCKLALAYTFSHYVVRNWQALEKVLSLGKLRSGERLRRVLLCNHLYC